VKKIICIVLFIILACAVNAQAQTWYTTNQATVAWNPVTTLSDGTAVPAGDVIRYQLYLRIGATGDGTPYGLETEATQTTVTFTTEGAWFIGIKALRYMTGETAPVGESSIAWSNTAEATSNIPFGIRYYAAPASVGGLKRVP